MAENNLDIYISVTVQASLLYIHEPSHLLHQDMEAIFSTQYNALATDLNGQAFLNFIGKQYFPNLHTSGTDFWSNYNEAETFFKLSDSCVV